MPVLPRPARLAQAVALLVLGACAPDAPAPLPVDANAEPARARAEAAGVHRQYGPPVKVGEGAARTYVLLDAKDGQRAVELGVALDEGALRGLPTEDGMYMYDLRLPARSPAPYQFVQLDWNAHGHPPMGVYTDPHFDFHFYTISKAERDAIMPSDPAFAAKANRVPTPEYLPPHYVPLVPPGGAPADAAVPMMGVHWFDVRSPEFNGGAFTRTFIYGTWDGQVTFYEPMITRAHLLSRPDAVTPIPSAAAVRQPGSYPTAYRVSYDAQAREYRVALSDLVAKP
ncbi:DUF5602 domain-containing protein [Roseisolibacter sp. H3M3-2]|uniref:DUF5602 domain-containing protein n=1 Tax=Roseisolibacter sp. H3M3-2 TaxID=3031323 RepID=UPI0023DB0DF3|nr:DUF5602 domain-containing protein [Roseisolibacter sp. H3M3-2]MDF1505126.1 DUF5602 domain-containing protein [Roseisolibacter sp. H3M3-2]